MSTTQRSILHILLLALGLTLLPACRPQKDRQLSLALSIPAATHGWAGGVVWNAEQGKRTLETEYADVEVRIAASADAASQAEQIENLLVRRPDALIVMAQEPGPLLNVCRKAVEQGIFLTIVSNPLDQPIEHLFVNGDNLSFGRNAAIAIGEALNGNGNIVVMEGIPCPVNSQRIQGFTQTIRKKFPGITILESQSAWWNSEKGMALMENFLLKHPRLDGVWAGDDDVLIGALQAYRQSGRTDVRAFVGGGGSKTIVGMLKQGDALVKATVTYPPQMIREALVHTLAALRRGERGQRTEQIVPSHIVTPANAGDFYFPESVY